MSAIRFHARRRTESVSGAERGLMAQYCADLFLASLGELQFGGEDPWMMRYLPPDHWIRELDGDRPGARVQSLRTHLRLGEGDLWLNGERHRIFDVMLNTALVLGSPVVAMAAVIHAQCEIHGYVRGKDREWLAAVIRLGLEQRIFREGMGWDGVIGLLEESAEGEVVTSFSVCDSFPNRSIAGWQPEGPEVDEDAAAEVWYDLSEETRWDLAIAGLKRRGGGARWTPMERRKVPLFFGKAPITGLDFRRDDEGRVR